MSLSLELFGRSFILNSDMWSKKCYPNILCWIQVPTCISRWTFWKSLLFNSGMWSEKYFNLLSSVVNSNIWKVTISLKQEKWFWIKKTWVCLWRAHVVIFCPERSGVNDNPYQSFKFHKNNSLALSLLSKYWKKGGGGWPPYNLLFNPYLHNTLDEVAVSAANKTRKDTFLKNLTAL